MNYKPNKIKWNIGDIVIHDCDSKKEHMLMKVIDISIKSKTTIYHTKYIGYKDHNKIFTNNVRVLHDPQLFSIEIPSLKIKPKEGLGYEIFDQMINGSTRNGVIEILQKKAMTCPEIAKLLNQDRTSIHYHLKQLCDENKLKKVTVNKHVFYGLNIEQRKK